MEIVHVAVAVIERESESESGNDILIARRPDHVHQGGLWEFPGGKVEPYETVQQALKRELNEELGIDIDLQNGVQPLLRIRHDYTDKSVLLDVWKVTKFSGKAKGLEGQPVKWVGKCLLTEYDFPEANKPIISAINLPQKYLITGDFDSAEECVARLKVAINEHAVKIVQFRCHQLRLKDSSTFVSLARSLAKVCHQHNIVFLLNSAPSLLQQVDADGIHLTFTEAMRFTSRPLASSKILGISCHNETELMCAKGLNPDYVILSPVKKTMTHVDAVPLGWKTFQRLTDSVPFPVFALGGMASNDMAEALSMGAQGIAAIREWW